MIYTPLWCYWSCECERTIPSANSLSVQVPTSSVGNGASTGSNGTDGAVEQMSTEGVS